jgi:SAM-dependent methyltransferase
VTTTDDARHALAQLDAATKVLLSDAATIGDALAARALSDTVKTFARRAHYGTDAINAATELKVLAVVKLYALVREGQERGEIADHGGSRVGNLPLNSDAPKTYADLGIDKWLAGEMRMLGPAYTPDDVTAQIRAKAKTQAKPLQWDSILRDARTVTAAQRRKQEAADDAALVAAIPPTIDIRHGDLRTSLEDLAGTVDAIICDPPYEHDALPLLGDLRDLATRLLKPDGVMVVMFGTYYLREAFNLLEGGRPYRWTAAYLTPGAHAVHYHARITQGWKPLLVYGGGPRFHDVFRSPADDKEHHHWGQSLGGFLPLVETFTRPGQLVVDPFLGGGTTALACLRLDRAFVGCDIDADAVERSRRRLGEAASEPPTVTGDVTTWH